MEGESRKQIKNPYLFKGTFSFPTRIVLFYIWTNLNETKVEQPFGNLYHGSYLKEFHSKSEFSIYLQIFHPRAQ